MGVQISVPLSAHSSLGHVPVVALLDPVVILCLIFLGTARLFATAAAPLAIPISCARGFWFLQIGGRSISCSRSRGWGTGRGELRVLTRLTCRPESEPDGLMVCL